MSAPTKNAAAAALGRRGGKARVAALTEQELIESARNAAMSRWGDRPKCPCGAMTIERAKKRGHKC